MATYQINIIINDDAGVATTRVEMPDNMPLFHVHSLKEAYEKTKEQTVVKIKRRGLTGSEIDEFMDWATVKDLI